MILQGYGERVAHRAENRLIRLSMPIKLVRRAEEFVGLKYGHASDLQPAAAVRHRDGRGGNSVAFEPGLSEIESI